MNKMLKNIFLLLTAAVSFGVVSADDNCACADCNCAIKEVASEVTNVLPVLPVEEAAVENKAEQLVEQPVVEPAVEQSVEQSAVESEVVEAAPVEAVTTEDMTK